MKRFLAWLEGGPKPAWQFWDPRSGALGGVVGGVVIWFTWAIVHFAREML